MPIISCRNVDIKYDTVVAVRDVSFDLEAGDYLCVVGENGSGKSTLMKGILGLNKYSGKIEMPGIKRTEIGYMPQQTAVRKDFPAGVSEVVLSGCLNRGSFLFYNASDKERAYLSMKKLGIEHLSKKPFCELSRGLQQRVLLARALCASRKMIMLDEPVSGLDPEGISEMYSLLSELNREGMTVMMISHDIENALRYGGKILHMNRTQMFFGLKDEYAKTALAAGMLGGSSSA